MSFTYSSTLLSREEVVSEALACAKRQGITGEDPVSWIYGIVAEIVNDPEDVLNHIPPERCVNNATALSDYYYLLACSVQHQL